MKNQTRTAAFLTAGLIVGVPALAAESGTDRGLLDDKFTISLGTFFLGTATKVAINGSAGESGTVVDLEEDLGLNSGDRFRVDAGWHFGRKHHLRALYFDYGNHNTRTLDRSITVGDTTYNVNTSVESGMDTTILELVYEYAFVSRENWELLGSAGAHLVKFQYSIEGTGSVNGGPPVSGRAESSSVTAPLPVFGLRYIWRFAPDWYLEAQGQYFGLEIDNVDGKLTDLRAGVTWMVTDHFGIGGGWNRFTTDVDISRERFAGSLDWSYSGAQVYLTASW